MSRGPGRIERAIMAALEAEPDNAFTVADLCDRAFPGVNRMEKKHRVTVLRAMKAVETRRPEWRIMRADTQGGTLIIYDRRNPMAYGMAFLKHACRSDYGPRYRRWWIAPDETPKTLEAKMRAELLPGGRHHHDIAPGGGWWRKAEIARAECDGEQARADQLKEQEDREHAAWLSAFQGRSTSTADAAKLAGFKSEAEYFNVKLVVDKGIPELVAAMDEGKILPSAAAELAKLPPEKQREILVKA